MIAILLVMLAILSSLTIIALFSVCAHAHRSSCRSYNPWGMPGVTSRLSDRLGLDR